MQPDNLLIQTLDNLVQETYKPTEPGAAVIVVRDGETAPRTESAQQRNDNEYSHLRIEINFREPF